MKIDSIKNLYRTAFTLIELLVVIAIIGILSGLIVVSMSGVTNKATIAKAQVFSNSLRNSLLLNLVSEWKFDEASGTSIVDSWSGGHAGTLVGATHLPVRKTGSECINGSCLSFDGIDDYVTFGNVLTPDRINSRTYSVWIKPAAQSNNTIFSLGNLYVTKGGYAIFSISSPSQIDVSYDFNVSPYHFNLNCATDLNQWNYLTFAINVSTNTTVTIYKNGIETDETIQARATTTPNDTSFSIGTRLSGASNLPIYFFNGLIDDVRVYDATISTSQIKEQYYAGLNNLFANGAISSNEYYSRISEFSSIDF